MAITVKHLKVSAIPDSGDDTLIEPSDWNADHELTGTVPVSNGGTGAATLTGYVKGNGTSAMTASSTIPNTAITGLGTASTKDAGSANGVATLDSGGKVPVSELPAAVLGALSYQGTWNASTNTPTLTSSTGAKGYYYVVSVAGSTDLDGITDWVVGDWAVFNGSVWQQIDNTDAVTSVNGQVGTVVLTASSVGAVSSVGGTGTVNGLTLTGTVTSTGNLTLGGTLDLSAPPVIGGTTPNTITGTTINADTKVVSPDYYAQSILGGNLRTSGGTSLLNWDGGGSGNITINGGLTASPANKNISLSPSGTGSVTISPATAGAMNNVVIGATTPLAITGTTVTATTFSGSGASLTSIPNSALVNSAITINGNSTALGGSVSVGTVTSVAATAGTGISVSGSPITGSGTLTITNTAPDQTVAFTNGTGISVTGTYPNFTVTNTSPSSGGTVTAVSVASANGFTGTSSGGATPALTLATSITGMLKGNGTAISAGTAGTDYVAPATATSFTAQQYFGNVALTDASTISWAGNTAQVATFTFVSSNRTMGAPTGLVSGAYYGLAVIQNGGSNTLTWNSVFKWAGGTAPTLSTAAGAKDYFVFRTDGTNMYEQGRSLGVA